jgi:hypothetical protein
MTHPLLIDPLTDTTDSSDCSARLLIITVHITHMITHGLVLYLDMDRHVYKSALKVPRDFRSDLVVIPTIYSVSLNPSRVILGILRLSRRRLLVRPYPLISTIYLPALKD